MRTSKVALLAVAALSLAPAAFPLDPPHNALRSIKCESCHQPHAAPGGTITKVLGNANLCMSCHTGGGLAAAFPFSNTDQAAPAPGLPSAVSASGTSHRWDSGASGRVSAAASNTSTGRVQSGGAYSGVYPKAYTITITTAGNVGVARFGWSATSPPGGTGANILTGAGVVLDQGITVTFTNGTGTSFALNDRWYVYVRPDIRQPVNGAMAARIESGKIMCSTCHDQHSQAREPFDPAAPAYGGAGTGAGRHFQRITNDTAQMCTDCHAARNVTSSAAGSHPVGVPIPAGAYQAPATLPLDQATNQVRCLTCHTPHYSASGDGTLRRVDNITSLCTDCHTLADTSAVPAKHLVGTDSRALWPGGQYGTTFPAVTAASRQGTCTNCHQPHGWPDTANTAQDYPRLLVDREENLCYTCHDGAPVAKDVRAQIVKTYRHPAGDFSARHTPGESASSAFADGPTRHAECVDCHDPHQAKGDATAPTAPAVSNRNRKVSGVQVTNGAAGTVPAYAFVAESTAEYQICFKCHSSWTTQPAGQSNMALKLNPNNPSYHPVEAAGKNTGIRAGAFVAGWSETRLTYCSDCHSSDTTTVRGPHGSTNARILERPYTASSARMDNEMASTEVCFKCHAYNTYANRDASTTQKQYSRFYNGDNGHTFHVGDRRYSCFACHDTHGQTNRPHLIITGRSPEGIQTYTHTASGGTCSPTCHGTESYNHTY